MFLWQGFFTKLLAQFKVLALQQKILESQAASVVSSQRCYLPISQIFVISITMVHNTNVTGLVLESSALESATAHIL